MRIGICGGTFDPLHKGHLALVEGALASGLVDKIIVIPAGTPPHKKNRLVSPALYRFVMAQAAFAGNPAVTVSDIEILRQGPSYTLDTANHFRRTQPHDQFFLIYGSDILCDIENWHQPLALLASFKLLLADRGGIADTASRARARQLKDRYGADISFFTLSALELSATQIRQRAGRAQDISDLVPRSVNRFIEKHALYHWQAELAGIKGSLWDELHDIERDLWSLLTEKRQLHSLNVMRYALFLAVRHQVCPQKAGLAAILHDCAKNLSQQEQVALAEQFGETGLTDDKLLHGPAGAQLAKINFAVNDQDVLRAICYHSTGRSNMTKLDQIIFLADKIEPARAYADLEKIRQAALLDLDRATLLCLQEVQMVLARKKLGLHHHSMAAWTDMTRRLENKQQISE